MSRIGFLALACALLLPSQAKAGTVLFSGSGTGSNGITLNAEALFSISGSTLTVTLRNTGDTSGTNKDLSANTLTGVFFDLPDGITLTATSATIAPGDLWQANKCDVGPCNATTTNVGGEFVYDTGTWAGHTGATSGIASSGYIDAAVGMGNFGGPNLDDPSAPDGINFGIIAPVTVTNPFKGNGNNMTNNPLIEGEVVFTLAITGGTLLESQISNVSFQYGTSLTEPHFNGPPVIIEPPLNIPEPATLLLFAPALALAVRRRARTNRA